MRGYKFLFRIMLNKKLISFPIYIYMHFYMYFCTMRKKYLTVFLFLIIPAGTLFSQPDPATYPTTCWNEIKNTNNDSLKIVKLFDLAFFYFDWMADNQLADSVSQIGLQIAEMSHRPELRLLAYSRYIESNNLHEHYHKALDYALKAEQVSFRSNDPESSFWNTKNIVSVYLGGYDYDKALEYSYKELSIAGTSDNNTWKATSYLDIGKCLEGKNQKIEAFRNYLNATDLAERIKNTDLQMKCYARLSDFYNLNKVYKKAVHYKLLESDLLGKSKPVDSVALMWTKYDLQVIDLNSNNNWLNEGNMKEILDFATGKKHSRLLKFEIALVRSHLIEADKIGRLHDFYYELFPAELNKMASFNPGLYNRLKAYFCEYENKPDSALFYFNSTETILRTDPNKILQSNFYNRFGQFLLRHGLNDKAIEKFSRSYELARSASYFDYMLTASKQLESLYAGKGDYKDAYSWAVLTKVLSDSINNASKQDQLLVMEIDHEARQRDLAAEMEKQSTSRRHYLQYTAILIIIIAVFIVLLMLGSLKVPEWIIKMLGFFSFIFLFEFIILIADHKIQEITQGEPWTILLIKIFLIAILLPMHQWIENRVISFLLKPGLINIYRYPLRSKLKEHIERLQRK
jgi:hypothetical protein